MKLREIARLCGAGHDLNQALAEFEPAGVTIDSRSIRPGELFVAIPGARHDGHQHVTEIFEKGAAAALVVHHRLPFARSLGAFADRLLFVENTACALQQLAARVLASWGGAVIGVTGSAGKTTMKDLTAHVVGGAGRVISSLGNLNTTYGLPLTVTRMITNGARAEDFDFAVLEMGMSSFGEIARLVDIAPPQVGVVGNVGHAHIEFFGSSDAIARAKAELVDGIEPGGAAVLNADDPRVSRMSIRRTDLSIIRFGVDQAAEVTARGITEQEGLRGMDFTLLIPGGEAEVNLPLSGRHNVSNALAAAAVGSYFGLSAGEIAARLGVVKAPKMRGQVLRFANGVTIVDDSYNSNPPALTEAVRSIARVAGFKRRIVVAGEMLELGSQSVELHRASGGEIARAGIELVLGVRGLARELVEGAKEAGSEAVFCETTEDAARLLVDRARSGDVILIKGSRGVRTEAIVERLQAEFGASEAG
ncbi:MAG: UDP-N-acetylmuramoyl-tripeptide--D-alanyl-D-alanine ligase [Acidobacteriota bacterium]